MRYVTLDGVTDPVNLADGTTFDFVTWGSGLIDFRSERAQNRPITVVTETKVTYGGTLIRRDLEPSQEENDPDQE